MEGNPIALTEEKIAVLKATSGAKFFDPKQSEVFPTADFEMCTKTDIFDFAMELISDGTELPYMKKVKI
jgi:hypothetical protein